LHRSFDLHTCIISCFRCFLVSPGSNSCTSEEAGASLVDKTVGERWMSDWIEMPDVDKSTRFCSAIC
jgi:hypothetical protein